MASSTLTTNRREKLVECLILGVALFIALLAARPHAGGWNDGSRLATVESLVDRHTWIIDHSTFVQVPPSDDTATPSPYNPDEPALLKYGTLDKLFIDGHYYSDKSPVPALYLAGWYQLWQWTTGWTAREHPDHFCWIMTLASSGLAYVLAVFCIFLLGRPLRLPLSLRLALTSSFALATVAVPYTQHVNNHILLLGVMALLVLRLAWLVEETREGRASWLHFGSLGTLTGIGYTIDLGAGPVILLCTSVLVATGCLSQRKCEEAKGDRPPGRLITLSPCLFYALAVLPWLGLHHAINYAISGSLKPANANPEYFCWPGSPFDLRNLTGSWIHSGLGSFLLYATSMLAGKRGFLGHNLPLFAALPAVVMLLRHHRENWWEVLWAIGCCGGTWLLYAATSNNSSGRCCSIRWFVPLLAPAYYLLALFLHRYPQFRIDFLILSIWGILLVMMMREGTWMKHVVPFFWLIQTGALCSWALCHHLRRQTVLESPPRIALALDRLGPSWRTGLWRSGHLANSAHTVAKTAPLTPIHAIPTGSPQQASTR